LFDFGFQFHLLLIHESVFKEGNRWNLFNFWVQAGYRHIDCAPPHEAEVGQAFREAFSQGMVRRDEVFVTSKLPSTAHEPQDVLQTVQKSLR
jgi:diketogulonate reductase-like aldo/keto reductase